MPKRKESRCSQGIVQFDFYAKPISLTYKGQEKFKTQLGGSLSIIVIFFLVSVFGYYLKDLVLRNRTSVAINTLVSISNTYTPPEVISAKNITFAIKVSNYYGDSDLSNPLMGKLVMT
jgi:hypothetical protein